LAALETPIFSAKASASSRNSGECCLRSALFVPVLLVIVHLCRVVYSPNRVSIGGGQDQKPWRWLQDWFFRRGKRAGPLQFTTLQLALCQEQEGRYIKRIPDKWSAGVIKRLKRFAQQMTRKIQTLYLASRDPRTPLTAKCLTIIVVAYALSPIDLIPDFIPVLGYLDDMLLLPAGIYLSIKLIPEPLWQEFQAQAEQRHLNLPKNRRAAGVVGLIWFAVVVAAGYAMWRFYVE